MVAQKVVNIFPVDVAEWVYEPRRSSRSSKSAPTLPAKGGPITFRAWDFDGINQVRRAPLDPCCYEIISFYTTELFFKLVN